MSHVNMVARNSNTGEKVPRQPGSEYRIVKTVMNNWSIQAMLSAITWSESKVCISQVRKKRGQAQTLSIQKLTGERQWEKHEEKGGGAADQFGLYFTFGSLLYYII